MLKLKGNYSGDTSYSVGDVVQWTDGTVYVLKKPCPSGTPPTVSRCWERLRQYLDNAVNMIMDGVAMVEAEIPAVANNLTTTAAGKALDARQGKALKTLVDGVSGDLAGLNPDSKTIRLASSTASSTKVFDITVDDDGELAATEHT